MVRAGLLGACLAWLGLAVPIASVAGQSGPVAAPPAARSAEPDSGELIQQARTAFGKRDRKRLAELNAGAQAQNHMLAPWVDYWDLNLRLSELRQSDLDAFYARWPGSYAEDRLRNDWLLELGHRRDWANFARDHARYQMRDDREVACYALLTEHQAGRPVREAARAAWLAQREFDEGCNLLAKTLLEAKRLSPEQVWDKVRLSMENLRPRAARQAAALLGKPIDQAMGELQDNAGRYLTRKARTHHRDGAELTALTLLRVAANDASQAADLLRDSWSGRLPADLTAWLWAQIGRQAAFRLQDEAVDYFDRAFRLQAEQSAKAARTLEWSDDTLAWGARTALRGQRWPQALRAIALLSAAEQREPVWLYWRARALLASGGEAQLTEARALLQSLAGPPQAPLLYYGRLAAEDLGLTLTLPGAPLPLTAAERARAQAHAGLARGLRMMTLGLRDEGRREWNFALRGMTDRELLAAAQEACDRELWDRCINTSDRSRLEIDLAQRYPLPYRDELVGKAAEAGVDPAYVYGLIRQESRFQPDARSAVGAAGLMQVMPATARWTAKKVGLPFRPEMLLERDFNLRIGASYLKLVLDGFEGSQALAAAAYNAGPTRPRRWREGPTLDSTIWVENIPFFETRDYVRKVLLNAAIYAHILGQPGTQLRGRLGAQIGPKPSGTDADPAPSAQELAP